MQTPAYVISRLPAAFAPWMIHPADGRTRPAGDTVGGGNAPAGAAGTDGNGFYVDSNCNVLAPDGSIAGGPGSSPANGAVSTDPHWTNVGGAGVFNCGTGSIGGPGTSGTPSIPGKAGTPTTGARPMTTAVVPASAVAVSKTTLYVVGGIAALVLVGATVYFASRPQSA